MMCVGSFLAPSLLTTAASWGSRGTAGPMSDVSCSRRGRLRAGAGFFEVLVASDVLVEILATASAGVRSATDRRRAEPMTLERLASP